LYDATVADMRIAKRVAWAWVVVSAGLVVAAIVAGWAFPPQAPAPIRGRPTP